MQDLLFILILVFCFFLRVMPRLKMGYGIAADSFFHIKQAELIRKNHFKIFYKLPNSVINIVYSYPFLYHWLLALLPDKSRLWGERLTGAFFDTINLVIIHFFINAYIEVHQIDAPFLSLLICFLYSISPALLRFNGGPRSFNGSPRILGQTLYMLNIFGYLLYSETGNYYALVISIIGGGLIFIGTTFGTQVLLFFTPFICFFYKADYAFVLLASFIFIFIFSFGLVIRVFTGHFNHVRFLAERISQQSVWQNTLRGYFYNLREFLKNLMKLNFKKAIPYFHHENYPLHNFLFYYPSFLVLFKFSYFNEYRFLYVGLVAAAALYFFTSLKRFKFLGEPVRYLDYVLVPSYFLSYIFLNENDCLWIFYVFMFYSLISVPSFINQFFKLYKTLDSDYKNLELCYSKIDKMETGNFLSFNSNGHSSFYFSKQPIVNALIGNLDVKLFPKEESDLVIGNYPYPGKDFNKLISTFQIKYIVLNETDLRHYTTKILDDPSVFHKRTTKLFETQTAIFFRVD